MESEKLLSYLFQAGGPAAVACLGWWLSGKFQDVREEARKALTEHEICDVNRHLENLDRFSEINQCLARLERNGHK